MGLFCTIDSADLNTSTRTVHLRKTGTSALLARLHDYDREVTLLKPPYLKTAVRKTEKPSIRATMSAGTEEDLVLSNMLSECDDYERLRELQTTTPDSLPLLI